MTKLALRGLMARKLRTALSAIAVLLGVAMIAGTYILTDQITEAFEGITEASVEGIDVIVTPKEEFTSQFMAAPLVDESLVERIAEVPGVEAVEPQQLGFGRLLVDGEVVETLGGPTLVIGDPSDAFDSAGSLVEGRDPERPGETMVLQQTAEDEGIEIGEEIGIGTRTGIKRASVVGIFQFGEGGSSLGGTSIVIIPPEQVQKWFDQQGKAASISVIAEDGVEPGPLARNVGAVLPSDVRAQTAAENADESAEEINDQIGSFLTPALLALAGAAVLVGAFIIFNTFSITVAQRMREFAMLRALGATGRQVMATVVGEALLVGVLASAAGLAVGIGFAKLLSALFDATGFGIPRADLALAPRTIIVALAVGIGVTVVAALVPAARATRIPPIAAISGQPPVHGRKRRRVQAALTVLALLFGIGLAAQGLFGSGPAASKLGAIGGGVVMIFIGVALSARYIVRPLAAAVGYPIERLFKTPGRLARENAERNPSRTAITSAALMVGVGLVVFVAVFAAGLKSSFSSQVDELLQADAFVYGENFTSFPSGAVDAARETEGVETVVATLFDQLEVNGEKSNSLYDIQIGLDPASLPDVYAFEWIEGEDSLLAELGPGETLVEEQFALAHDVGVGDSYEAVTPSGGKAELTAIGIYRDPTILQGSISTTGTLREISPARDPFIVLVGIAEDADAEAVIDDLERRMEDFPGTLVESKAGYKELIEEQLDQIVYLLYALLLMSVVISLFGIANSLFLSVHERTREIGTLRAIGATAAQLRRVIRYESVITAVIGALLGIAIGILFAFLVTRSLSEFGLGLAIPVGQLAIFLVIAVIVGVVGAIAPARRAARISVLEAIRYE